MDLSECNFDMTVLSSEDLLQDFTCLLCYGVAINPLKCDKCEQIYCSRCLPKTVTPDGQMNSYGAYTCYKKCGSRKVVGLSRIEKNILNSLSFQCQHADEHGCTAVVKYEFYKKHLQEECVHKLVFPEEVKKEQMATKNGQISDHTEIIPEGANLARLFFMEGDEPLEPEPIEEPVRMVEEEEEDIDMGNLFGDDDDY